MKNVYKILCGVCFLLNFLFCVGSYGNITLSHYKPVVGIIQNSSMMVFAIATFWVGFIYPKVVQELIDHKEKKCESVKNDYERIQALLSIIMFNGFVIIFLTSGLLLHSSLKGYALYITYYDFISVVAVFFFNTIALLHLSLFFLALAVNFTFIKNIHNVKVRNRI